MSDYYEKEFGLMDLVPKTGTVFFDVGANEGGWTIPFCQKFQCTHAFEPDPRAHAVLLDKSVQLPAATVTLCTAAVVGLSSNIITLQLFDTSAHTCSPNNRNLLGDDTRKKLREIRVPGVTLDDYIVSAKLETYDLSQAFVKIDVEGAEFDVLFGMGRTLTRHKPHLLIEIHSAELHAACTRMLQTYGYQCDVVRHPGYKPESQYYNEHLWLNCHKKAIPDATP